MMQSNAAELRPLDSARSGAEIRAISAEVRKDLSERLVREAPERYPFSYVAIAALMTRTGA